MPILGLTDRHAAFPRIGILRKGAPKLDPKRPGKDLDFFRFDSTDEAATKAFAQAYGDEPKALNVYLPYATPEGNFQAWREEWVAGGLVHRCDGQMMTQHLTEQGGYSTQPAPCPYTKGKQRTAANPGCKPVGRLMVIVPELKRLAYVLVQTSSIHDIIEIQGNLEAAYALRGNLQGIPFVLRRQAREISTPGQDGKRARRVKYLLFIEPSPEWVALQMQAMRFQALPSVPAAGPEMAALAAGPTLALPVNGHAGDWDGEDDEPEEGQFAMAVDGVGDVNMSTGEIKDEPPAPAKANGQQTRSAPAQPAQPAQPAPDADPLKALWQTQAKNFAHAPNVVNGQWGAVQAIVTGIAGDRAARLALYSMLFGRSIASSIELTAPERAWLHSFMKPYKDKSAGGWHANAKAESDLIAFVLRWNIKPASLPPAPAAKPADSDPLAEIAAENAESVWAEVEA